MTNPNTTQQKVHENRLRRMAKRQGLAVRKSLVRDPHALGYGKFCIADPTTNSMVYGGGLGGPNLTLDEVETWLTSDSNTRPVEPPIEQPADCPICKGPCTASPPARHSDPAGLARLHSHITDHLAKQYPGTRWRVVYDDDAPEAER